MSYFLVFVGGGIGAAMRHGVNRASVHIVGADSPLGTLIVNLVGCGLMGLLAGSLAARSGANGNAVLFVGTGIRGGFTTFSAFSLDTVMLWQRGEHWTATAYAGFSVALSIAGLCGGLILVRSLAAFCSSDGG